MSVEGRTQGATEWETSRVKFIGRGRSLRDPACLDGRPLGGTVGTVLDPIVSLRQRVRLAPGGFVRISFATGAASDRAAVMLMAQKYHDRATASRIFGMARTSSQMHHRHLGVSEDVTRQFDRLASRVFSLDDSLRGNSETIARNTLGVSSLWGHGISGDLPIVLVFAALPEDLRLVQQVLEAQEYWRLQGLRADVVILSSHASGYLDEVHAELATLLEGGHWAAWKNRPGGVFLLRSEAVATEDRWALEATAKVVLVSGRGELVHHLDRPSPYPRPPAVVASHGPSAVTSPGPPIDLPRLMSNSLGGFSLDGREYVIVLRGDRETPAPWANVLANPEFGTIVTASGSSFTWSGNSRENRLTPWANDSVSDPTSETILVRDDDTMDVWGSTPGPLRRGPGDSWIVRHGFGTTRFERGAGDLRQTLDVFAAPADPVKLSILSLTNEKSSPRRLSVFGYVEWLLGAPRVGPPRHVVTSLDPETSALLAVNRFRDTWNDRIAFLWSGVPPRSFCGDRRDFIGRNGALDRARALVDNELSNRVGAGLDPCAALQVTLTLEPGETREIVFILGEGRSTAHVRDLIRRHGSSVLARRALAETRALWDGIIGAVQVRTPDDSFDLMVNGWLQYQNISARLWARTGFYQPGGAFGFRDQLQDVMALAYTRPDLYRRQILLAAEHQFIEGDVQHWWHPPLGQGTRTRCSDDLLWLPYAAAHYIAATGDRAVLDEKVPFINAPQLTPGQVDSYTRPTPAESGSLFEHCVRAINRGINLGAHGLPLIGSGDWNDGMNLVGREGRGESVWLGWFLYRVLSDFTPLAEARDEGELAARYRTEAQRLKGALELAWDGEWYRRAYFDDETPLGTVHADECQIDSVAQSWAVLSKAAPLRHAERAMDAVRSRLIRRDAQVILLLAPPFDRGTTEPGYIKAYPPGIRENGGQYTHAAVWTVMALTSLGYGDEGVELFHMLNPINHTRDANAIQRYAVEPYVVAADVYTHPQHTGRGGWTWYTASAGLMYRAAIESILGLKRHGRTFAMDPCIPAVWSDFHLDWRHGTSRYRVTVNNAARCSSGVALAQLDGAPVDHRSIPLVDDGQVHEVHIVMGLGAVRPQNGQ
jgi:cyclic beta-1,2-glucan synthetase